MFVDHFLLSQRLVLDIKFNIKNLNDVVFY